MNELSFMVSVCARGRARSVRFAGPSSRFSQSETAASQFWSWALGQALSVDGQANRAVHLLANEPGAPAGLQGGAGQDPVRVQDLLLSCHLGQLGLLQLPARGRTQDVNNRGTLTSQEKRSVAGGGKTWLHLGSHSSWLVGVHRIDR